MHYVIIGNGVAGITAARTLRERNPACRISIISSESDHFFSRTALMYAFCGQMSRRDLEPFERDFYDEMRFERVRDEVVEVRVQTKSILLKSGGSLNYDELLIASGSIGRRGTWKGSQLSGVTPFVTLSDLDQLEKAASGAKRAVVIGGGLIGVEVAEILAHRGIQTEFLVRDKWYWPVALNEVEAQMVADHMSHHVKVRLGAEVEEILGSDHVTGVRLKTGEEIPCDVAGICIGVTPNTEFLKESGLNLDKTTRGIEVDEYQRTSNAAVFAAGDCAVVSWFDGKRRPEQLWYTARDQGKIAALNMLGEQKPYRRGTLYNSAKLFDIEYTTAGLVNVNLEGAGEWYQRVPGTFRSQRIVFQNGAVVGFNMLGSRWDHSILTQWIEERRNLSWVLKHLRKAQFDCEFSEKFKVLKDLTL